jgi:hypothetical protein
LGGGGGHAKEIRKHPLKWKTTKMTSQRLIAYREGKTMKLGS